MNKLKTKRININNSLYPVLLLAAVVAAFLANYRSGSYLIGWDSLQTELAPFLAIKRAWFSGWQEYQSFGLTSGMAHAADLVRAIFLYLVSFLLPQSAIRYVFNFTMLYVGGLGFYFLLQKLGFNKDKRLLAFLGALFYMFNFGSVQILSLPFEPFSVFFAFLPWEMFIFLKFIYSKKVSGRLLLWFIFINLLATPQAYLQTLFLVYMLCLFFLSFGILLISKNKKIIKRFILAFGLIVIVNSFWILPQLYFLKSSFNVVQESKINQLATKIVIRQNFEKGTVKSFARLEGFYYDLFDTSENLIFKEWHEHFSNIFVWWLSYIPFFIAILGLFRKHKAHYGLVSIFILVSLILLSNTKTVSTINSFIFSSSFISQIFRSPFTKFIVPYSLVFTYLFVCGLEAVYRVIIGLSTNNKGYDKFFFGLIVVLLIVVYTLPTFKGNFISSSMRVKVPGEYFEVIDYFKKIDKNKRIALLPDHTFWGWFNNEWGYDGSGFIWYGIEQPIISRTFDVWSFSSESYYWEVKSAIESRNVTRFERILDKYNINYLLVDRTLNPVSSVEEGLQYDQLDTILGRSKKAELVESFGQLEIYQVKHGGQVKDFVSAYTSLPKVMPEIKLTNHDEIFYSLGNYQISDQPTYYYPFNDLFTQTDLGDKMWTVSENDEFFILSAKVPQNLEISEFVLDENMESLESVVFLGEKIDRRNLVVETEVFENKITLKVKKELVQKFEPTHVEINNCRGVGEFGVLKRGADLSISSEDRGLACFGYESSLLDHWNSYLVKVNSENIKGNELFFYIFGNRTRKQSRLETNLAGGLEYFIINPGYYYDDGYFFSFQNPSYETLESENKLKLLEIYLFPFDYIKKTRLVKKESASTNQVGGISMPLEAEKINYFIYKVRTRNNEEIDLVLNQTYDPGWRAYIHTEESYLNTHLPWAFGIKVNEHFRVNNWANGWNIPPMQDGEMVVLIYIPQYLEYTGLIMLTSLIFVVFVRKTRARKK